MMPVRTQTERGTLPRASTVARPTAPAQVERSTAKPPQTAAPEEYECGAMGAMRALGFLAGAGTGTVAGAITGFVVGGPVGAVAGLVAGAVLGGGGMAGLFRLLD